MSLVTCLHPNCPLTLPRGRYCCRRHYFQLDEGLRREMSQASKSDPSVLGALKVQATEYLESRLIGDHEISTCRGRDCGADIVWLVTAKGKDIAVNADTVKADDDQFKYGEHIAHFTTCPNADDFRKQA